MLKALLLTDLKDFLYLFKSMFLRGMPNFEIVGLPDTSVRESKERVKIAIKNSGFEFLSRKILVNLAPANTKKGGSIFDLAIAIGILKASR